MGLAIPPLERLAFGSGHRTFQLQNRRKPARCQATTVSGLTVRRGQPGRPAISHQIRALIRQMCRENPGWGAPRIHGELLKLGIDIGESSVSKYMVRGRRPPSQTWRTFLDNHVTQLVSIDLFTVPTLRFQVLYVFLVLAHDRRRIVHCNVDRTPDRGVDGAATAGGLSL